MIKSKRALVVLPMALAASALIAALYGGLVRLGWDLPALRSGFAASHGALMIGGFFGTLITAERAVALATNSRSQWAYAGFAAPALSAAGALLLVLGMAAPGKMLIVLSSLALVAIYAVVIHRQPAPFMLVMGAGGYLWLIGNALWAGGEPVYRVVYWWMGFLVLTIVGERLELVRVIRPSRLRAPLFFAAALATIAGIVLTRFDLDVGARLGGAGMIALAGWLLRYDIARQTVRQKGLTRYMALCLLAGYAWLAVGGVFSIAFGGAAAGFRYDALLHAVLLGFVVSMVFGHAPIIIPALLKLRVPMRRTFYAHLALLHAALVIRLAGDLLGSGAVRRWGGLFNEVAFVLFLANTALAIYSARSASMVGAAQANRQRHEVPRPVSPP